MHKLDDLAPNFRRVAERWGDAPLLVQAYESLANCFDTDGSGLVEYVKSFIEHTCITIELEHGASPQKPSRSTTEALVFALKVLGIENTRGASKLDKVLSAFNSMADALSDMRNQVTPVAHGKDGYADVIAMDHARTFLHVGDAILGLILAADSGKSPNLLHTRALWNRFPLANMRVERSISLEGAVVQSGDYGDVVSVKLMIDSTQEEREILIEPSRLLYAVDRITYLEILEGASRSVAQRAFEAVSPSTDDEKSIELPTGFTQRAPDSSNLTINEAFQEDAEWVSRVVSDLVALSFHPPNDSVFDEEQFTTSIVAVVGANWGVDWMERSQLQSKTRTELARFFHSSGYGREASREFSSLIVSRIADERSE